MGNILSYIDLSCNALYSSAQDELVKKNCSSLVDMVYP